MRIVTAMIMAIFFIQLIGCGSNSGDSGSSGSDVNIITPPAGDTTAPTLTINVSPNPALVGEVVTATFLVSEESTGLSSSVVQITKGTMTAFSQTDATHYSMTVTAAVTPGTMVITVPGKTLSDAAGNVLIPATLKALTISASPIAPWASAQNIDAIGPWADLTVINNGVTAVQRFRWIKPGTFIMGSPIDEPGHDDSETQHQVTLTKGFWMGDSECTQRMWKAVMTANPSPSYFTATGTDGLDLPVDQVTWNNIQSTGGFFERLATLAPTFPGTLPTEAQWEYACRAGTTSTLYTGPITILGTNNAPALDLLGWYAGNSGVYIGETSPTPLINSAGWAEKQYSGAGYDQSGTHHVKRKSANAWGLYDMLGNVWEWCADDWMPYLGSIAVTDPFTPPYGSDRTLRGGCWRNSARGNRVAFRDGFGPSFTDYNMGFRICAPGQPRVAPTPRSIQ